MSLLGKSECFGVFGFKPARNTAYLLDPQKPDKSEPGNLHNVLNPGFN